MNNYIVAAKGPTFIGFISKGKNWKLQRQSKNALHFETKAKALIAINQSLSSAMSLSPLSKVKNYVVIDIRQLTIFQENISFHANALFSNA